MLSIFIILLQFKLRVLPVIQIVLKHEIYSDSFIYFIVMIGVMQALTVQCILSVSRLVKFLRETENLRRRTQYQLYCSYLSRLCMIYYPQQT